MDLGVVLKEVSSNGLGNVLAIFFVWNLVQKWDKKLDKNTRLVIKIAKKLGVKTNDSDDN